MKRLRLVWLLVLTCLFVVARSQGASPAKPGATPAAAAKSAKPAAHASATPAIVHNTPAPIYYDSPEDRAKYLPDSAVILTVADRKVRVGEFIDTYFSMNGEFRPKPDSLGRVEFLNTLINKNVLGLTATAIARPLAFEDRAVMREHTDRVLGNVLFRRLVQDSVVISDADIAKVYEEYKWEIKLRHIQCPTLAMAQKVRLDLLQGKTTWSDAVKNYSQAKTDKGPDGEVGWASRRGLTYDMAQALYGLRPGGLSTVFLDGEGYQIVQVSERRQVPPPSLERVRKDIYNQLFRMASGERADQLQTMLGRRIGFQLDTANVRFASAQFVEPMKSSRDAKGAQVLTLNEALPEFQPADTSRVLATFDGGRYTLKQFLEQYSAIPVVMRPFVNEPQTMAQQVRSFTLTPMFAQYARELGLDKDPLATLDINRKIEQIRVEHLVQDSVESKVFVSRADQRKYYDAHKTEFVSFETRDYASFACATKGAADSLAARLRAGTDPRTILREDSLAGRLRGSIQTRRDDEHGAFQKILFQELKEGQVTLDGPGGTDNGYAVIKLIAVHPSRQLAFEDVDSIVEESMQNMASEKALDAFIAKNAKRYKIEAHPELVMKIRLVDPTL
jgi:parvulin-like peptidyl-prolyl isomerase